MSLHLHAPSSSLWLMLCFLLSVFLLLSPGVYGQGRLKLTVLSEDRLQMKWKEADGPVQGYKVRVKPISEVPQPELMLTTTRGRATVAGLDSSQEYALQVLVLNGTTERLLAKRRFTMEGLRDEEMIRSGSREQKKKMLPGGSGSGDLDDVTEALIGRPTVLYPDPTNNPAAAAPTTVGGKAVCLVCGEQIAVFKDYNLSRHYETKHAEKYKNLTDAERARTSNALLAKLQKQQGFFTKLHTSKDAATKTSFVISHKIAKHSKPFSEGEFVKECLVDSAALICPEKKEAFEAKSRCQANRDENGSRDTCRDAGAAASDCNMEVGKFLNFIGAILLGFGQRDRCRWMSPRKPFECETDAAADIVLLVDGSWSIGRTNFRRVRDFLEGLMTPFNIGPDHIQIGLTQYSGDPRTEWHLNNFTTKEQLLEAVRNFRYKGGNTFTGQALLHVMEENMRPEAGARSATPFFLVLLTDGKSQDDAIAAAERLKNAGVEIIAVGVKNADEAELRQVASEPVDLNVYNVNDFPLLSKLVSRLVHILCRRIEDRGISKRMEPGPTVDPALSYPSPSDLRFSQLGSREVQLHWTNPAEAVQQFRVVYHSAEGQSPQEVVLGGSESTVLLEGLSSQTLYHVSIFPVYENNVGLALRGTVTTLPLATPANLEVTPSSYSTLQVSWGAAPGATQYMILYSALSHGEPDDAKEEKFSAEQTAVELTGLLPATDYSVTLYALYEDDPSDPVTAVAATFPLPPPMSVEFPMVTHSMLKVSWVPGAGDVPSHRITYSTNHGSDIKQVEVTGLNSVVVQNLSSLSRYLVSVQSNYPQGLSAALTSNVTTLKVPSPSDLRVTNFSDSDITVRWQAGADDVVSYLIKWISLSGGDLRQLRVSGESEGAILEGVEDDKEYQISLSALYGDGAQSEAVAIRYSTSTAPARLPIHRRMYPVHNEVCPEVTIRNSIVKGFDMMEAFGLTRTAHSSVEGVAAEPFVFNTLPAYTVFRDIQLTQNTKFIHPAGLSPEHTISIAFRVLQETPREPFALWQLTDNDFQPKMGLVLDPTTKHLVYFSLDYRGEVQELTFDQRQVHRLFYGSFHKIHLTVSQVSVSLSVDCQRVGERPARPLGSLPTDGFEMLGKLVKTRGPKSGSAPFQLQSFEIVCNTTWAFEDTCCDLPAMRDEESCPAPAYTCTCSSDVPGAPGSPGPTGKPGTRGEKGEKGDPGHKGEVGPAGKPGFEGGLGALGSIGPRGIAVQGKMGPPGARGGKGDPGRTGIQGLPGPQGSKGEQGVPGPLGIRGLEGNMGGPGLTGPRGFQGRPGHPGPMGERGLSGLVGPSGLPGGKGERGEKGEAQSMAMIFQLVTQACEQLVHKEVLKLDMFINEMNRKPAPIEEPVGPPGEPGIPGPKGPPGSRGSQGNVGSRGRPGRPGYPGEQGGRGMLGAKGDAGPNVQGPTGIKGFAGPLGEAKLGDPGSKGDDGKSGLQGISGTPGQPGEMGPPGLCDNSGGCNRAPQQTADPYYGYQP
ncbi:collagen alpha-1(XIV) chain [Notothenia coriiceps]|uniref:Collagen alpha-1(XIV) chain n=1 Tax=Notothenia coriiceps TaxID=8208 RepID=A0A6I9NIQ5_9TELE|nr:PREDICTED: collagen alpha-1(XIV) chain-like [Notothenia coriiceps]